MQVEVNKEKLELDAQASIYDVLKKLNLTAPDQAIGLKINGVLSDFNTPIKANDNLEFISFDSAEGKHIFWHSTAHVLAQAILRLWPEAMPTIGPAIEQGFYYDFANLNISEEDFGKIEKEMKKIISENHRPKRYEITSKEEALEHFKNNPYKKEIINEIEGESLSAYEQGEFFDLCRGPHLPSLSKIKAVKLLKTSGAYWRADQNNEMLTRIYGISFPDKQQLSDYLNWLEEAKKRDHKVLGRQLDLYSFHEEAAGMIFLHPKGLAIWNELIGYLSGCLAKQNYHEIKTPLIMSKELWVRSGHWSHYRENMYTCEKEDRHYAVKPMNCPGCMIYYNTFSHSYRELPLRVSEIGLVHRYEASGALHGLFRVRSFHQDDAHIFMKPQDIKDEILTLLSLCNEIYMTFGLTYRLELSTRPEKSKTIGSDEDWELTTNALKEALDEWGHTYKVNEGDGAFYGPKIDIHIKDAIGREWQCGTIQLDMSLPQKFDLEYVDSDGNRKRPIMLHRAIYGSIERFFGILTEHFAGKFPFWLSPIGVRIICVSEKHIDYANELLQKFKNAGINADIDSSNESVGKKIRNAQLQKINYMLTVGDQEMKDKTINVRTRDNVVHGAMEPDGFINKILEEKKQKLLMSVFAASSDSNP